MQHVDLLENKQHPLVRSLSTEAIKVLVQEFVSSRLDWTPAAHCCKASPTD